MTSMLSNTDSLFTTEIKNKGFAILDTLFKEHGWHLIKNDLDWIFSWLLSIYIFVCNDQFQ